MPSPKRFDVVWSPTAKADLLEVVGRIADESPGNAELILERIERAASRLEIFPGRGRIVPELKEQGMEFFHELVCRPWRIIYRIEGRAVWVSAVIDGRRNLEDLLLERFLH